MEFRFDAMLHSNLGNENSYASHIEFSRGLHIPHSCSRDRFIFGSLTLIAIAVRLRAVLTCNNFNDTLKAGLKPMQPMQLHWAPRLWGPAPWCLGRLFMFARYTFRLRIQ